MAIRTYKPTSPARRFMSVLTYEEITKKSPEKSLVEYLKKNAGRNKQGKITVRHQGGGNKIKYRVIDFKRNKLEIPAKVAAIEYDPNRSAFIALLFYADGEKRYILAPLGLNVGDTVVSSENADIKPGNALPLANIPVGTLIHNLELKPGRGGQLVRSAGMSAQLMAKENGFATVRLPSGEMRKLPLNAKATIGTVGNTDHENVRLGKAGRVRHMGVRRGQEPRWSAGSCDSVGQARSGPEDPQAQEVFQQDDRQARWQVIAHPTGRRQPTNEPLY